MSDPRIGPVAGQPVVYTNVRQDVTMPGIGGMLSNPPIAPPICSVAIGSAIAYSVSDYDPGFGGAFSVPLSALPSESLVIVMAVIAEWTSGAFYLTASGAWRNLAPSSEGIPHESYRAMFIPKAAPTPNLTGVWTPGGGSGLSPTALCFCSVAVATKTPGVLQFKTGVGPTVDLDNPPTPGNYMVMADARSSGAIPTVIGSWGAPIGSSQAFIDSLQTDHVDIWIRCVQPGDAAAGWGFSSGILSGHPYMFVAEIPITL